MTNDNFIVRKYLINRNTGEEIFYSKRELNGNMIYFFRENKIVAKTEYSNLKNFSFRERHYPISELSLNMFTRKQL